MIVTSIRRLRRERGLTLRAFADRIEMDIGYLSIIERGLVDVRMTTLARIAHGLGVDTSDLLREPAPEPVAAA